MSDHTSAVLAILSEQTKLLKGILKELEKPNNSKSEYITVAEAGRILKRSKATIHRWIKEGKIQGIKLNNQSKQDRFLIPKESIENIIKIAQM